MGERHVGFLVVVQLILSLVVLSVRSSPSPALAPSPLSPALLSPLSSPLPFLPFRLFYELRVVASEFREFLLVAFLVPGGHFQKLGLFLLAGVAPQLRLTTEQIRTPLVGVHLLDLGDDLLVGCKEDVRRLGLRGPQPSPLCLLAPVSSPGAFFSDDRLHFLLVGLVVLLVLSIVLLSHPPFGFAANLRLGKLLVLLDLFRAELLLQHLQDAFGLGGQHLLEDQPKNVIAYLRAELFLERLLVVALRLAIELGHLVVDIFCIHDLICAVGLLFVFIPLLVRLPNCFLSSFLLLLLALFVFLFYVVFLFELQRLLVVVSLF
mmetsp:Transcript_10981/g.20197  ORF Transcript_10981/g.20197 Transcript_10981/m.20197 type:complete len:320 (-) Transcript_10981:257-1216(-)